MHKIWWIWERKKREQIIKNLEDNVSVMNKKVENLKKKEISMSSILTKTVSWFMGWRWSDGRFNDRNNINENEDWDFTCRCGGETHRIGKKKAGQNKPRTTTVKRSRHNVRKKIFSNKKFFWKGPM